MHSLKKGVGLAAMVALLIAAAGAEAQMDFAGEWPVVRPQDNTDNPHLGEYVGIPLSREAIRRAEIWDASIQSLPEWQCRPHSGAYIKRGPSNLRVWKDIDPASRAIIAFQTEWLRSVNTPIYMDGRPHGTPSAGLPPVAFVNSLQTHDQVGNRAFGDRIAQQAALAGRGDALRALTACVLLAPAPNSGSSGWAASWAPSRSRAPRSLPPPAMALARLARIAPLAGASSRACHRAAMASPREP